MLSQILTEIRDRRFGQKLPRGPVGLPFIGQFENFRQNPLTYLQYLEREYGDIVFIEIAGRPFYVVNRPEYIQELLITQSANLKKALALELLKPVFGEGLLTSEGAFHKQQKKLAAPAFARAKLAGYAETMIALTESFCGSIATKPEIEMHEEMMHLTLKIVAKTLFGSEVGTQTEERVAQAIHDISAITERVVDPFGPILNALPTPKTLRFHAAIKDLDEIIFRIIAQKKFAGGEGNDLLSTLMAVRDEDGNPMSDKQLRDECLTIFLAGHETTANAMSWTWYLISQHPEVLQKLETEWEKFSAKKTLTAEDYTQLIYTRQVVSESMRLYPPAWIISRQATADITLGEITIPKDALIIVSQWAVHHSEKYWPAAEQFNPDRFESHATEARHKFTFFPFGGGVRQCIGDQFAWMETVLLLATIGRRYRFAMSGERVPEPEALITLRPKGGLKMKITKRSAA